MKPRSALAVVVSCVVSLATPFVAGAGPWSLAPGESFTDFRFHRFNTDQFYDSNGDAVGLARGGVVEERGLEAYSELGWKKRLSFILALPGKSLTRRPDVGTRVDTETGFGDLTVGFRFNLLNGATALAIEGDWKAPLGYEHGYRPAFSDSAYRASLKGNPDSASFARQAGRPALGDGQEDFTGSLLLGMELPALRGFLQLSGGYRYRTEHPADQFVSSADLGFWVLPSLMVAGRYEGASAVGSGDAPTDEVDVMRAGGEVAYRAESKIDVYAGALRTISGTNALQENQYYLGIRLRNTRLNRLQGFLGSAARP